VKGIRTGERRANWRCGVGFDVGRGRASLGISTAGVKAMREKETMKKSKTFHGCVKKGRHQSTSMLAYKSFKASAASAGAHNPGQHHHSQSIPRMPHHDSPLQG
jgi:hypothetical protein